MREYTPYIVSWNLTKRCNLLCPHCYIDANSELTTKDSELTTDEALHVIDELSSLNTPLMLILTGGEPMLRKDIFKIVEYSSRAGFITVLGSNGTLLTKENLQMLKRAGLKGVGISIDSVSNSYHDSFRGLQGAWEMSVSALRHARELGIETQIDVTLTDKNFHEIEGFIGFASSMSVKAVNFFFLVCTGKAMKTDITSYNYEEALRKIVELSKTEKWLMVKARCAPHIYRLLYEGGYDIPEGTRGCLAGRHYMRIAPEGNITPCPYMDMSVGNIKEKSLLSIWDESLYLKQLREGRYSGRCGRCEYAEICGGCRARAYSESGDFMAEDSLCLYTPTGKAAVSLGDTTRSELMWDEDAKKRILKVPAFMQNMVIKIIEAKAKEKGISFITQEFIDEVKKLRPGAH
ncbi:MAG: radical SAM protein [Nitrospirae bacterium]|nr:radical SAM protein [Nitrospirota bacterium]